MSFCCACPSIDCVTIFVCYGKFCSLELNSAYIRLADNYVSLGVFVYHCNSLDFFTVYCYLAVLSDLKCNSVCYIIACRCGLLGKCVNSELRYCYCMSFCCACPSIDRVTFFVCYGKFCSLELLAAYICLADNYVSRGVSIGHCNLIDSISADINIAIFVDLEDNVFCCVVTCWC